ncbi:MAG: hypothetical protein AB1810_07265 [Pseudomonadota bacterium]
MYEYNTAQRNNREIGGTTSNPPLANQFRTVALEYTVWLPPLTKYPYVMSPTCRGFGKNHPSYHRYD